MSDPDAGPELHGPEPAVPDPIGAQLLDSTPAVVYVKDLDGVYRYVNAQFCADFGGTPADFIGRTDHEIFPEDYADRFRAADLEVIDLGLPGQYEEVAPRGGQDRHFVSVKFPLREAGGDVVAVGGISTDVTELQRLEREVAESRERLLHLTDGLPGVAFQMRREPGGGTQVAFVSPGVRSVFELDPDEVQRDARLLLRRIHPDDAPAVRDAVIRSAQYLQTWSEEFRVELPGAGVRWVSAFWRPQRNPDGSIDWFGYAHDVTERHSNAASLWQSAAFDEQTELPSAALFLDRLDQGIRLARREGMTLTVLVVGVGGIDTDRPSDAQADLLHRAGRRIRDRLRESDTVARYGGNQFAVLLLETGSAPAGERTAAVLRQAFDLAFDAAGGSPVMLSCSIGSARYPLDGAEGLDLVEAAERGAYLDARRRQ